MSTDLGAFLYNADADFLTGLSRLLLQSAGSGKACRAGADNNNVELHKFAFHGQSPQGIDASYILAAVIKKNII
jgi:hypothetical protein